MKKYSFILALLLIWGLLPAQSYLSGKITDSTSKQQIIYYDRTQYAISSSVFQSIYKVMDARKKVLYTITATHNQNKSQILINVKTEGGGARGFTVTYNPVLCGLIFSNKSNIDTSFPAAKFYDCLLSFTDRTLDYPVIHKIMTGSHKQIILDPLSKLRIKKHNEIIRRIPAHYLAELNAIPDSTAEQKDKARNDAFNAQLLSLQTQLYAKTSSFAETSSVLQKRLEQEVTTSFKDKHIIRERRDTVEGKGGGNGTEKAFW